MVACYAGTPLLVTGGPFRCGISLDGCAAIEGYAVLVDLFRKNVDNAGSSAPDGVAPGWRISQTLGSRFFLLDLYRGEHAGRLVRSWRRIKAIWSSTSRFLEHLAAAPRELGVSLSLWENWGSVFCYWIIPLAPDLLAQRMQSLA